MKKYQVTLQETTTRKKLTTSVYAHSLDEAHRRAAFLAAKMLGFPWMLSRITVLIGVLLLLSACTSSTGGSGVPSLTCEQRFDRALEQGVSYTEALGSYTQCLIDRGDTVNTSGRNY